MVIPWSRTPDYGERVRMTDPHLLKLYKMHVIRMFEDRCEALYREAKIRAALHLSSGQEAIAVGTCSLLVDGDVISATYRGHGWALARGVSLRQAFGEILGRTSGCAAGRGGTKHFGGLELGMVPTNAIVGAGIPIAVGFAMAAQMRGQASVAVAAFGEGATSQGVFHEALSLASLWRLPVVFICENNRYSEFTSADVMNPAHDFGQRGSSYGLPTATCDGMDLQTVIDEVGEAVERARTGGGPSFVVADTYRFGGHMTGDSQPYREKSEVEKWRLRDPIQLYSDVLRQAGVRDVDLDGVKDRAFRDVEEAELAASADPEPQLSEIGLGTPSWNSAMVAS